MKANNRDSLECFLEKDYYTKISCRDSDGYVDKNHVIYYRLLDNAQSLFIVVHRWKAINNKESFFAAEIRHCGNPKEELIYASYGDVYSKYDLGDNLLMRSQLEYAVYIYCEKCLMV